MGICQSYPNLGTWNIWNKNSHLKLRFLPKKWVGLLMVTGCHLRIFLGDVDDCHRQADARMKSFAPFGDGLYIFIPAIPSRIEMVQKVGFTTVTTVDLR